MRRLYAFTAFLAAFLFFSGCDDPPDQLVNVAPEPPPTAPVQPDDPPPSGDAEPSHTIVVTTTGDSLAVPTLASVAVGDTVSFEVHMRLGAFHDYGVVVGMEKSFCETGAARIVSVTIPEPPEGRLSLADDFTAWFEDACFLAPFRVLVPGGGKTYEFTVQVEGLAPGRTQVRTYMELLGFPGESFRYPFATFIRVDP